MFKHLVRVRPNSWQGHNQLAVALIEAPPPLQDPEQALVHARRAVELTPRRGVIQDTLIQVLMKLERRKEAIAALQNALGLIPADDSYRPQLQTLLDELSSQP